MFSFYCECFSVGRFWHYSVFDYILCPWLENADTCWLQEFPVSLYWHYYRYKFILCENTECLNVTTVVHFYASTVHALGHRGHLFQVSHSPSTSWWSAGDNRLVYALFWNNNNDRLTAFDLWNRWKGNGQPANPDLESVRHCYSVRQKYYFVWG